MTPNPRSFMATKQSRPYFRVNYIALIEHFEYLHKHGTLGAQLPFLKVLEDVAPFGRCRQQVQGVLALALKVTGQPEPVPDPESVPQQQVRVYALCHGGFLGSFAATQPADFYIDDRCGFSRREKEVIYKAVARLIELAKAQGMDTRNLPQLPEFHHCGIV